MNQKQNFDVDFESRVYYRSTSAQGCRVPPRSIRKTPHVQQLGPLSSYTSDIFVGKIHFDEGTFDGGGTQTTPPGRIFGNVP